MRCILQLLVLLGLTSPVLAGDVLVDLDAMLKSRQVEAVDGVSSAGQPDEAALRVFAENAYRTVIDLRTASEKRGFDEPVVVEKLGMVYVTLPIGKRGISFESARQLDQLIADADGPVLLHCASGNRVGALLALRASMHGASDAEALAIGKEAGMTGLEKSVRKLLARK